jgi:hypothetical protein
LVFSLVLIKIGARCDINRREETTFMKRIVAEWINLLFGLRKFFLMLVLYIVGIIFRIKGLINGSEMVDLFKATTVSFFAVNAGEHALATIKAHIASKVSVAEANAVKSSPDDQVSVDTAEEIADDEAEAPSAGTK